MSQTNEISSSSVSQEKIDIDLQASILNIAQGEVEIIDVKNQYSAIKTQEGKSSIKKAEESLSEELRTKYLKSSIYNLDCFSPSPQKVIFSCFSDI